MRPAILNPLFADITVLSGVGPKLSTLIARAAGPHVVDLILTPPSGLVDRSFRPSIADAPENRILTLEVTVDRHHPPPKGKRLPYKVICSDETGYLTLVFFHARADYLQKTLPEGEKRLVSGKIEDYGGARQMVHPDYIADPQKPGEMPLYEPVYPLTAGLSAAVMRKAVTQAVQRTPDLPEWQEPTWLKARDWKGWKEAIDAVHAPHALEDLSSMTPPRQRIAYDELLANQLALALIRKARIKKKGRAIKGDGRLLAKARAALPFSLTNAQKEALKDIFDDMRAPERMVRLLQGDVGSGKTIVAFLSMLTAVEAGAQAALMAPTEILARQHLESLASLAEAAGVTLEILTGRDKGATRVEKLERLKTGAIDILIGTHALFQEGVDFRDLALVVIDEQHRFGVRQRVALAHKGPKPDLLVMTATPIPRTLSLTAYGDMEHSRITEKPPGRKPVDTRAIPMSRLDEVIAAVKRVTGEGNQAYWVCPLVEESDVIDLTAAEERFESLKEVLGERVGLVHGRMSGPEKDAVMERFYRGDLSVLIATTVIEVGVNAPNATIMIIEHAERFGLAQLHQLRGRVGRGDKKSSCILLYRPPLGETAKARLKVLRDTEDGFVIAEEDLRLRGAGDVLGAAQSGFPHFRLADIAVHGELLAAARDDAKLIMERDPELKTVRGEALRTLLYLFSRDDAVKLLSAG
ncbi:ATP-dependent DNA helicase RecG [Marinicaulis flavus]|uniref:ATP-dependent DNA helicase RecG n=1 Tax=Hyphococcus luteus TaxID=2058213 RepID=A0A2S7K2L5_9PROT|nr:ATP-dependent DNA helicase RecG [Marinicaulis flavus]PQA86742.1 ATP-dependent DNA helicase RecG [Marinicaulis flavus]